jgi:hypothetical protein
MRLATCNPVMLSRFFSVLSAATFSARIACLVANTSWLTKFETLWYVGGPDPRVRWTTGTNSLASFSASTATTSDGVARNIASTTNSQSSVGFAAPAMSSARR